MLFSVLFWTFKLHKRGWRLCEIKLSVFIFSVVEILLVVSDTTVNFQPDMVDIVRALNAHLTLSVALWLFVGRKVSLFPSCCRRSRVCYTIRAHYYTIQDALRQVLIALRCCRTWGERHYYDNERFYNLGAMHPFMHRHSEQLETDMPLLSINMEDISHIDHPNQGPLVESEIRESESEIREPEPTPLEESETKETETKPLVESEIGESAPKPENPRGFLASRDGVDHSYVRGFRPLPTLQVSESRLCGRSASMDTNSDRVLTDRLRKIQIATLKDQSASEKSGTVHSNWQERMLTGWSENAQPETESSKPPRELGAACQETDPRWFRSVSHQLKKPGNAIRRHKSWPKHALPWSRRVCTSQHKRLIPIKVRVRKLTNCKTSVTSKPFDIIKIRRSPFSRQPSYKESKNQEDGHSSGVEQAEFTRTSRKEEQEDRTYLVKVSRGSEIQAHAWQHCVLFWL